MFYFYNYHDPIISNAKSADCLKLEQWQEYRIQEGIQAFINCKIRVLQQFPQGLV